MSKRHERTSRPDAANIGAAHDWAGGLTSESILRGTADEIPDVARCRRCHRPIQSAESLRLGVGPRCKHLEHCDLVAEVFGEVLAAC